MVVTSAATLVIGVDRFVMIEVRWSEMDGTSLSSAPWHHAALVKRR